MQFLPSTRSYIPLFPSMLINVLLTGILVGFSIAVPVGPIGILCIRRTLADGRTAGFVSGLGAATADALYGSIAAFGLVFITSFMIEQYIWLRLAGGIFLFILGVRTWRAKPSLLSNANTNLPLFGAYLSTFFLTLTNPMTILSFTAVFAGLGLVTTDGSLPVSISLVLGVLAGSALWWLLLSVVVSLFRSKINTHVLRWVNRTAAAVIITFGLITLAGLL